MPGQQLLNTGILIILIGVSVVFFALLSGAKEKDSNVKFSVFGLFGFIPFGFWNDNRPLMFGIILMVVVAAATTLLFSGSLKT